MNRLKAKTTATLLIAIFMISTLTALGQIATVSAISEDLYFGVKVDYSWPTEVTVGEEFEVTITVTSTYYPLYITYLALNAGDGELTVDPFNYYPGLPEGFIIAGPISATDSSEPQGFGPITLEGGVALDLDESYAFTWHITATQVGTYDWTDGGGSDRSMIFLEVAYSPHEGVWGIFGNSDFSETIITVTLPTIPEVVKDIEAKVEHHGIANSLIFKLQNALKALERGNTKAFENILNAFINQVEAQSGKKIEVGYANQLIEWANAWIGNP